MTDDEHIEPVEYDGTTYGKETPEETVEDEEQEPKQKPKLDLCLDDYDNYFKELMSIPEKISATLKQVMAITLKMDDVNHQIKNFEKKFYMEVSKDKDDDNKPRFTNESMREAETKRRTYSDGEVTNLRMKLKSLTEKFNDVKIEKEKIEYLYKCLSKGITLCELKANLRDRK